MPSKSPQVFWSDEDDGFIALAPDLPGCSAFGETQPEALAQLQDAIAAWIEATRAAGNPVPSLAADTAARKARGQ
jgi:predicted RNase H-like HicB family nuclease